MSWGLGPYGFTPWGVDDDFPCICPPVDETPPTVVIISPTPGTNIPKTAKLIFKILDDGPFERLLPSIRFPDSTVELVHDGEGFTANYSQSIREPVANGYKYTVERNGGWPANPTLIPFAFDKGGNETQ